MSKTQKQTTGALGERLAQKYLKNKGFTIIATNVLRKWGEIDIVAEKDGLVRFFEVKSQTIHMNGSREMDVSSPEEMAHSTKLEKVARTANIYMEERGDDREYQIDVLAVILDHDRHVARCRHYEQVL